jgi:hypothetical protein
MRKLKPLFIPLNVIDDELGKTGATQPNESAQPAL